MPENVNRSRRRSLARIGRVLTLAFLWLVIAGPDPAAWLIGVPTIAAATHSSMRLARQPMNGLSAAGVLAFIPYFLWQSLRGGLDVARRVLRPVMRIDPGFQRYPVRLGDPRARVVFLDSVSLLPGTLSADMRGGVIEVHALDARADLTPDLADLERRVARLFGESLTNAPRATARHG